MGHLSRDTSERYVSVDEKNAERIQGEVIATLLQHLSQSGIDNDRVSYPNNENEITCPHCGGTFKKPD